MIENRSKSDGEIYAEFAAKVRRLKIWTAVGVLLFAAIVLALIADWGWNQLYLIVPFALIAMIAVVFANSDWSCPKCGKWFRKAGQRIRFCPYCGVALVPPKSPCENSETGIQSSVEASPKD